MRAEQVLERLKTDFRFYGSKLLKVRTKDAKIVPLVLNEAQEIIHTSMLAQEAEQGFVRVIILKGRQQGASTFVGGLFYQRTSTRPAQKTIVVAHKAESTSALFDMTKRYHDNIPPQIRSSTNYRSKRELSFDKLDSSYLVVTAGGDDIARGQTLQNAHLSEVAFWPKSSAADNFNGLMKAIPPVKGSCVVIESTANGVSGVFADMWRGAVAGTNGFIPIFIPWFMTSDYQAPVPEDFRRTLEEEELSMKYGLTDAQLAWRRIEVSQSGRDKFKQEYPCCAEEAFLTSGSPVFHPEKIAEMIRTQASQDFTRYTHMPITGFVDSPRGDLFVWEEPIPGKVYFIGADVAMGVNGGDYSVAQVLDEDRKVVARFRARVLPEYFADILYALGRRYNTARVIVENNGHGFTTCGKLGRDMAYPNFYMEETLDKETQEFRTKLGFATNVKTKPLIIDELRTAISLGEIVIPCRQTLNELQSYIVDESGRMGAENGSDVNGERLHDDTVMALALANHIYEGKFTPIDVTDDFYHDAP